MQFFKFLSLFALSSVAAAQLSGFSESDLSAHDIAESAEAEYLAARDEYIKSATSSAAGYKQCRKYDAAKKTTVNCGPCDKNAAIG
ncbi:hypothetical protein V2G26_007785 [Clonostachys chloroleuca]